MGDLPQVRPVTGVADEESHAQPVEESAELDDTTSDDDVSKDDSTDE